MGPVCFALALALALIFLFAQLCAWTLIYIHLHTRVCWSASNITPLFLLTRSTDFYFDMWRICTAYEWCRKCTVRYVRKYTENTTSTSTIILSTSYVRPLLRFLTMDHRNSKLTTAPRDSKSTVFLHSKSMPQRSHMAAPVLKSFRHWPRHWWLNIILGTVLNVEVAVGRRSCVWAIENLLSLKQYRPQHSSKRRIRGPIPLLSIFIGWLLCWTILRPTKGV